MTFDASKRKFFKTTVGATAAVSALSMFPPSIRRALAIEASNATGTIQDVKHVVMLMLENRSFDGYFGTFPGVRGFGDRFPIPLANGKSVFHQTRSDGTEELPYHLDAAQGNAQRAGSTPHSWPNCQAAWDHGRMNKWPSAKQPLSMGYYETAEVPFHRALADAFTLCDNYHCSMHAGTIPNRLFFWTGTNGPSGDNVSVVMNEWNDGADVGPSTEGWTWTTYADRLQAAGVSWKVYQNIPDNFGCNEMMSFRHWRAEIEKMPADRRVTNQGGPAYNPAIDDQYSPLAKGFGNTMADGGFLQSLRDDVANGTLPEVSWIIPPAAYSEHPGPSSPAKGAWYIQAALDALTQSPEVWSKTVFLVTYDENDGFFDHMPTPSAPSRNDDGTLAGKSTLTDAQMAFEYFDYPPATPKQPPCRVRRPDHHAGLCDAQQRPPADPVGPHDQDGRRRADDLAGSAAGHRHSHAANAGPAGLGYTPVARAAVRAAHQRARASPREPRAATVRQRKRCANGSRLSCVRQAAPGPHSAPLRGRSGQIAG